MNDSSSAEERLAPLQQALESDGYELSVAPRQGGVVIRVVATPAACEECLVPKGVMRGLVADMLGWAEEDLDVVYPGEEEP